MLDLTGVLEHDAHQRVDRRQVGFVLEAEVLCEARLMIERDAIGSSPTFEVQDAANPLEELVGLVDGLAFGDAKQAEVLEGRSERDLEPREELHVTQPAGTLLHVGFEQGRRGTEALVFAARHHVMGVLETELERRNPLGNPPLRHIVRVMVSGRSAEDATRALVELHLRLSGVDAIGPAPLPRLRR